MGYCLSVGGGLAIDDDRSRAAPCETNEQHQQQGIEPIMADDGSGADITIPSFLLYKPDADAIKAKLRETDFVQVR